MTKNKEEVQKKYMELQMLDAQIKQFQQQAQTIEGHVQELDNIQTWLDDFGTTKHGTEVFVTLAPGILAKATITDTENVLVNVGAQTIVQKKVPQAKELIEKQTTELRKMTEDLSHELLTMVKNAEKLQQEIKKLIDDV